MNRNLRIVMGLLKWVAIPIGLLVVGYFLVGPQIGATNSNKKVISLPPAVTSPTPDSSPNQSATNENSDSGGSSSESSSTGDNGTTADNGATADNSQGSVDTPDPSVTAEFGEPTVEVSARRVAGFSTRRSNGRYDGISVGGHYDRNGHYYYGHTRKRRRTRRTATVPSENTGSAQGASDAGGSGGGGGYGGPDHPNDW